MRGVAFLEWYTAKDLSGISIVNDLLAMGDALGTERFELVLPARPGQLTWPDGFLDRPWLGKLPIGESYTPPFDHPPIAAEHLEPLLPRRGKVLLDYVLNQKFLHSAAIANALYVPPNRWHQQVTVPVVTWLTESGLDARLPTLRTNAGKALALASILSGPVLVMNEYDREWLLRNVLEAVGGNDDEYPIRVVPPLADFAEIDRRYTSRRQPHDPLVVFHGGSLERKRRLELLDRVIGQVLAGGGHEPPAIEGLFVTQHTPTKSPFENVRLLTGIGHAQYVDLLGDGDVVFVGAEYEGTGLAYMEAIRAGMLPLVYDAPWIRTRLPSGYPLVAGNVDELFALLVRLTVPGHLGSLHAEWDGPIREAMVQFEPTRVAGAFRAFLYTEIWPVIQKNMATVRDAHPAFEILEQSVTDEAWPEVTGTAMVYAAMKDRSTARLNFASWVGPNSIRLMLMSLGYEDVCDSSELHLRRP